MYCSDCGSEVSDRAKFCGECGAKVYRGEVQQQRADPSVSPPSETPVEPPISVEPVVESDVPSGEEGQEPFTSAVPSVSKVTQPKGEVVAKPTTNALPEHNIPDRPDNESEGQDAQKGIRLTKAWWGRLFKRHLVITVAHTCLYFGLIAAGGGDGTRLTAIELLIAPVGWTFIASMLWIYFIKMYGGMLLGIPVRWVWNRIKYL